LAVDIRQLLHPAVKATGFAGPGSWRVFVGAQFSRGLETPARVRRAALFEGDHEVPAILLAERKDAATAIQAVEVQTEAQTEGRRL